MSKLYYCLLFLVYLLFASNLYSQGLQFNSNDELIANRTSYQVFSKSSPSFTKSLSISFQLAIINPYDFGHIYWLLDEETGSNYSLTFANINNEISHFKFNIDGQENLITIPIKNKDLGNRRWLSFKFEFIASSDSIKLILNDQYYTIQGNLLSNKIQSQLYFGKRATVVEVPKFAIKDLMINGKRKSYQFKFDEKAGNEVHDQNGRSLGFVSNPNWLINDSYHWKLRYHTTLSKMAAINYDEVHERMVIVDEDSLIFYEFHSNTAQTFKFESELMVPLRLGTSFMDFEKNMIYVYELNDLPSTNSTLAVLHLDSLKWNHLSKKQLPQQRHHHNVFFENEKQQYTIFGGFGNQKYTNEFQVYDLKSDKWSLKSFTGDQIDPRFFSGLTRRGNNELIIFGGIGNKSGDQALGKSYYYDCHLVNIKDQSIKKLWELELLNSGVVSTRNMILSNDGNSFFTLCYPEYIPNSFLKLYQFNLNHAGYTILGDSIPIASERIETNANLYVNSSTNELYCSVQEISADGASHIFFYSLSIPGVPEAIFNALDKRNKISLLFWFFVAIVLFGLLFVFVLFYRKNKLVKKYLMEQSDAIKLNMGIKKSPEKNRKNAILLFGEFTVFDRNGKNISYLFSPKIKQLFLLILLNSFHDRIGVSSDLIYTSIWPEKPVEKAKNSKGVTLNQIRSILTELDGIELCFEKHHFRLKLSKELFCDYIDFAEQFEKLQFHNFMDEVSLKQSIDLIATGPFLKSVNLFQLDRFKNDFENKILNTLPIQFITSYKNRNYRQVIQLASILFNIDSLNIQALQYELLSYKKLNLEALAKKRYNSYIVRYKEEFMDDFPYTFRDMINRTPLLYSNEDI